MKKFSLEILCDDDFGVPVIKSWYNTSTTSYKGTVGIDIDGILSVSNGKAYIDDISFKGKNFWIPISKFLNTFDNIEDIELDELKYFLEQFGNIKDIDYDSNILYFDLDNAYDLSNVHLNNDRISFDYSNSPVNNFHLIDLKDHIKIIPNIFSNNYYTITESEWLEFMNALEIDLSESRNLKLNALLDEKSIDTNINLIRQMNFHCRYDRRRNSFVEKILRYHQSGYVLSSSQINTVKNILY
jgi:hypothetical protein